MEGTVGIPRGGHDIIDPVAQKADVVEVSFPAIALGKDGEQLDCTMHVWLAKAPGSSRWLLWRYGLTEPPRSKPVMIMMPPM